MPTHEVHAAQGPRRFQVSWPILAAVALYACSLHAIALDHRALTYHEVLYAQPAREMLASGDWLQPRMAGKPCNQKPPLTDWLIALSMAAFGDGREWAVRLPAVAGAALVTMLTAALATRWLGRRGGLLAGLAQATSFYLLRQARVGEADVFLCAAVLGAMLAFAVANVPGPLARRTERWLPWIYYLCAVVAFLAKGPIGLVFIFGGCGAFALLRRDRSIWRFLLDPIGLALLACGTLAWPLAAYAADPGILDDWKLHHLGRFAGRLGRKDPFYYLYTMPAVLLPWSPLVIVGLVRLLRGKAWRGEMCRFLACWMLTGLLIISACAFKRKHYAAPLLPPMALAASVGLLYLAGRARRWRLRRVAADLRQQLRSPRRRGIELAGGLAMLWIILAGALWSLTVHHDPYATQRELAARVNARMPPGEALCLVHIPENQIAWYLDAPLARYDHDRIFRAEMSHEPGPHYFLAPAYVVARLAEAESVDVLDHCGAHDAPEGLALTFARLRWRQAEGRQAEGRQVAGNRVEGNQAQGVTLTASADTSLHTANQPIER